MHKDAAGVYVWLPLGLKTLNNIIQVIREEMNEIGCHEVLMSSIQRKELWETTDRWNDEQVDVWFKSKLKNETEVGFAWSNEEQMVDTFKQHIDSYKDLPKAAYQFHTKMRNETRAKSGVMRTREFIMKDLYSFCRTEEEHQKFYDMVSDAYIRIFNKLGIGDITYFTTASGGAFAEFSHEFQTICDAGEDIIYIDDEKHIAINEEVMRDDVLEKLGVNKDNLRKVKAAEVGNIFSFGTTKSEPFDFTYADESGAKQFVVMGSYGIGPARVMGVIAEHMSDERGLVWPQEIAPYQVYLATIGIGDAVASRAEEVYKELTAKGIEVLYDDRDVRPGEKFGDADLMGIPHRIVISEKLLTGETLEYKHRTKSDPELLPLPEIITRLQ